MTVSETPNPRRVILSKEAAEILGCSIEEVRSLADQGLIKHWKLDGDYGFPLDEITRRKEAETVS